VTIVVHAVVLQRGIVCLDLGRAIERVNKDCFDRWMDVLVARIVANRVGNRRRRVLEAMDVPRSFGGHCHKVLFFL
jgi:hypothetical protein